MTDARRRKRLWRRFEANIGSRGPWVLDALPTLAPVWARDFPG